MGTYIRPELSEKNKYWLEKHRYYGLKHFCLQYDIWKNIYSKLDTGSVQTSKIEFMPRTNIYADPTAAVSEIKMYYSTRMDMIREAAYKTDNILADYILAGVTNGLSYDILRAKSGIPCCKDAYYKLYRQFFWLLSRIRK